MSTILKALRRLEQERSKGVERPLREDVVLARSRRRASRLPWAVAAGALVIGFTATWAILASFGGGEPEAPAAVAAAPPVVATPNAVSSPTPVPAPRPAPAIPAPPVASAPAPSPPAPVSPASRVPVVFAPAPARIVTPAPRPRPAPARPAGEPEEVVDDVVLTRPILGRAPRFVDEEEPARSARAAVPVRVVRTSWHPQPDRRAAWVAVGSEGEREVREGQWVGALEVRTIEPDGVLFADGPLLVHRAVGAR